MLTSTLLGFWNERIAGRPTCLLSVAARLLNRKPFFPPFLYSADVHLPPFLGNLTLKRCMVDRREEGFSVRVSRRRFLRPPPAHPDFAVHLTSVSFSRATSRPARPSCICSGCHACVSTPCPASRDGEQAMGRRGAKTCRAHFTNRGNVGYTGDVKDTVDACVL